MNRNHVEPSRRLPVVDLAPGLIEARRRHQLGRNDPAYIPPTAHQLWEAMCEVSLRRKPKPWETLSAAELEAQIRSCPAEEPAGAGERDLYDWQARRAALLALLAWEAEPVIAKIHQTFWNAVAGHYPEVNRLQLTTSQRTWAQAAVQRIADSYR